MVTSLASNGILTGLDQKEFAAVQAVAEDVSLTQGTVVAEAGQPAGHVYFPTAGVLSLVGTTTGGATVEVAIVGNEGVASISSVLGPSVMPFRITTQIPGHALRVPTDVVSSLLRECGDLHERLMGYTHYTIAQIAQSAVCNRFHNARQRLARWLLMTADRAGTNQLPLTHEFIAHMVGGPRSAVSEAASELRDSGAIDYRRGVIHIRDGESLKTLACECYALLAELPGSPRAA